MRSLISCLILSYAASFATADVVHIRSKDLGEVASQKEPLGQWDKKEIQLTGKVIKSFEESGQHQVSLQVFYQDKAKQKSFKLIAFFEDKPKLFKGQSITIKGKMEAYYREEQISKDYIPPEGLEQQTVRSGRIGIGGLSTAIQSSIGSDNLYELRLKDARRKGKTKMVPIYSPKITKAVIIKK